MNTQHKITTRHNLLDEHGHVIEPGYATGLILDYKRKDIKAAGYRIKEWDYYYVGNSMNAVAMTIADNSYLSLISVTKFDFTEKKYITNSLVIPFTFGRLNMPETSAKGLTAFKNKRVDINFHNDGKIRKLFCDFKNFTKGENLIVDLILSDEPRDSMVIATPFADDKTAFYYNHKINTMKATGSVVHGNKTIRYDTPDSLGSLDWGRGVWTYKNTWYWGCMSVCLPDGNLFGFNIGYGFGDTSAASENMVFYNGIAHKLSRVDFIIPVKNGKDDFMSPWKFTSDDQRFELDFVPILDRYSYDNAIIIKSIQNQVFGRFTGNVVLDDGTVLQIKDQIGFAEKVYNRF